MSEKKLREDLSELQSALQNAGLTEESRLRMQQLISDMEQQLDGGWSEEATGLVDRFEQSVGEFEVSHPTLTGIVNNILITLGNLGI